MPERRRESHKGAAKSSADQSKTSYSVQLGDDLLEELRRWPKADRKRVDDTIHNVQENFGRPHLHSGVGIRDLSPKAKRLGLYECRVSRALRLVFTRERPSLLYFHMIGTHTTCAAGIALLRNLNITGKTIQRLHGENCAESFGI